MEKSKTTGKKVLKTMLRFAAGFLIFFVLYSLLSVWMWGIDAGKRLPDWETVVQAEVWSSDAGQARIESRTLTRPQDITSACALLALYCDYHLIYMGVEDVPRLTVVMTLEDGSAYTVAVGNESVNFNGTFKGLRNKDAAKILTDVLLAD